MEGLWLVTASCHCEELFFFVGKCSSEHAKSQGPCFARGLQILPQSLWDLHILWLSDHADKTDATQTGYGYHPNRNLGRAWVWCSCSHWIANSVGSWFLRPKQWHDTPQVQIPTRGIRNYQDSNKTCPKACNNCRMFKTICIRTWSHHIMHAFTLSTCFIYCTSKSSVCHSNIGTVVKEIRDSQLTANWNVDMPVLAPLE